MNPLLLSAYHNNFNIFKKIVKLHVSLKTESFLYVSCNKMNNILHFAIDNQNEEMIKFIISCDAENNYLRSEINVKGKIPF